jgi:hypothetical protein
MAKFVLVKKVPEVLKEDEILIEMPDFLDEIKTSKNNTRLNGKTVTTLFFLKDIANKIASAYDPDDLGITISKIPYNKYIGIQYDDSRSLSDTVILPMLRTHYKNIFYKYLEKKIKTRAVKAAVIYFTGTSDYAKVFLDNGIGLATAKELKSKD